MEGFLKKRKQSVQDVTWLEKELKSVSRVTNRPVLYAIVLYLKLLSRVPNRSFPGLALSSILKILNTSHEILRKIYIVEVY